MSGLLRSQTPVIVLLDVLLLAAAEAPVQPVP